MSRVEENVAADALTLTAEQLAGLDALTPPAGDHHNEQQMAMIDRQRDEEAKEQRNTVKAAIW